MGKNNKPYLLRDINTYQNLLNKILEGEGKINTEFRLTYFYSTSLRTDLPEGNILRDRLQSAARIKDFNESEIYKKVILDLLTYIRKLQINQLLAGNYLNKEEIQEAKELIHTLKNELRNRLPKFTPEDFTRIKSDSNGNPRYVVHFLKFSNNYDEALKIARKFGGGKFHNKQYGGGIKFQEYNLQDLCDTLNKEVI